MENIQIKTKNRRGPAMKAIQHILNHIVPGQSVVFTEIGRTYEKSSSLMKARCTHARNFSGYNYSYRTLSRNEIGARFEIVCKH